MFDVAVVGAGPAGATAARACAKAGLETVLLERSRLPRSKLCGGGITIKVPNLLDFELPDNLIERKLRTARIHLGGQDYAFTSETPFAYMTSRDVFDAHLTGKAAEAGAKVVDGCAVKRVQRTNVGVEITGEHETIRAEIVIGCDGVDSRVARDTGLLRNWRANEVALGIEADVRIEQSQLEDWVGAERAFDLYFGCSPAGYGWIFPKRDRLTVGIGCKLDRLCNSRQLFERFLKLSNLPKDAKVPDPQAHLIPIGGVARVQSFGERVLLAGDSAAFVEPLLGEGIFFAIWGGKLAAETAIEANRAGRFDAKFLSRYEERWKDAFWADFKIAYRVAKFAYLESYHMDRSLRFLFKEPEVRRCMIGLMSGDITPRQAQKRLGWLYLLHKMSVRLGLELR